jgi:hypothetical protein
MPALQSNQELFVIAKQGSGKGTPAAAPAARTAGIRLKKVGGGANPGRSDGSENYSDGNRFTDATDFVDQVQGNGAPVAQVGPGDVLFLSYLMMGQETNAAAVMGVVQKTITPAAAGSFWFTAWKRVGNSPVLRQKFSDCRMTSLRIEGSSANKVVKATPTFFSLDAGETYTTDPTVAVEADAPWLYTEAVGTFNIDGTIFKGHSSFALVINDNMAPWYGDDVTAYDVTVGQGTIVVEGITLLVDDAGLQQYNKITYGSASPATGTKPTRSVYYGSYTFELKRGTAGQASDRSFKCEFLKVHWTPDLAIDGNPDGGPTELALAAEARTPAAGQQLTITGKSLDVAYA